MADQPDVLTESKQKIWTCGTLTYTRRALMVLFVLLLVGDFIWQLRDRSVGTISRLVFKKYEASDFFIGLMFASIPNILGLVISPVIAIKSDNYRSRWGRRIPFLLWTTPLAVLGMLGMAASPYIGRFIIEYAQAHHMNTNMMILTMLSSFWIVFELGAMLTGLLFGGLVNDTVPPQMLGRFYGLFRIMSLGAGALYNIWFLKASETHPGVLFTVVALIYGFGFTLMCLYVKEGQYPPPPPIDPKDTPVRRAKNALVEYGRVCFTKPFYYWVFAFNFIGYGIACMPINTFDIFYAQVLNVDMDFYGKCIGYSYICSIVLAFPLGMLADKWHPLRCSVGTIFFYAATCVVSAIVVQGKWTFGLALMMHTVCSGVFFTVSASLFLRLFPRVEYAQFSSAAGLVTSVGAMFGAPTVGWAIANVCGGDYRYLYVFGAVFSAIGGIVGLVIMWKMKKYGGIDNYEAP